jgi:hypothetical protein
MSSVIPSEKFLLGIAAHVVERQNRDRGFVGAVRFAIRRRGRVGAGGGVVDQDIVDSHRELDVLELLLANILERQVEPVADVVAHRLGHRHAAGLGNTFEPGRDIHAIAEQVVIVDNDVAKVDPDPEFDLPVVGDAIVPGAHVPLDFGGTFDRVHDAWELDQHPVAGQLHDAALMPGDCRIDQFVSMTFEAGERADLVRAHQAAVAHHIGSHDRGKAAFHPTPRLDRGFT